MCNKQVLDTANDKIRHHGELKIDQNIANQFIDDAINLLNDPNCLLNDPKATDARRKLLTVRKKSFDYVTNTIISVSVLIKTFETIHKMIFFRIVIYLKLFAIKC